MKRFYVLAVFVLVGLPPVAAWGASSEEMLASVREYYAAAEGLRARFVQTSLLVASGMETVSKGEVVIARGGRMRWSYEGDDPQVIVSDGETLWFHQVRDRTVLRRELESLPPASRLALDLLGGFEGVEEHFKLSTCGERCLELTPIRTQADLSRLRVELGPAGQAVRAVTTEDALGNRTRVEFRNQTLNPGVDPEQFRFNVPEGVQVLDMEEASP